MHGDPSSVSFSDRLLRLFCRMRWIPMGIRSRSVQTFRDADRTPDRRFSVPFFGLTYNGSLASLLDSHVYFFGVYEPEVLSLFRSFLKTVDSPVVADVGANAGQHSLFLSQVASQVHSFEPWSKVREQLLQRLKDNNIRNVKVYPVALGDKDESRTYYAPAGGNLGTGSFLSTAATDRNRPSDRLPIVNGDDYFEKNEINKVDLIKIDVEGWEWFVLLGLAKTIERCRPVVILEYSENTKQYLRGRSQLNVFPEYEFYLVGKHLERIDDELLPMGNLLMIPREKSGFLGGKLKIKKV